MKITTENINELNFQKGRGLLPAIVQDAESRIVLMQGYMNEEALRKSFELQQVTFFSRSKNRLWTKGESSGHYLHLVSVLADCDRDSLLVRAHPQGPTCHTGADTCFDQTNQEEHFLHHLERVIQNRKSHPKEGSYTTSLFNKGINKIAQKVGEEAVELIIEAKDDNEALFLGEAADLMYHYLVLLAAKGVTLKQVLELLKKRHQ